MGCVCVCVCCKHVQGGRSGLVFVSDICTISTDSEVKPSRAVARRRAALGPHAAQKHSRGVAKCRCSFCPNSLFGFGQVTSLHFLYGR